MSTDDDLEAQRHMSSWMGPDAPTSALSDVRSSPASPSTWVSKVHNALCDNKTMVNYQLDFCILKVPENRRIPPKQFTPEGWRLGLHNREIFDMSIGSERIKLSYAMVFGLVGSKWEDFCDFVVQDPMSLLQCYGLHEEATTLCAKEIKYVLALDALFLALNHDYLSGMDKLWCDEALESAFGDIVARARHFSWKDSIEIDLVKVENQIPFFLVERTVQYLRGHASQLGISNLVRHLDDDQVSQYLDELMKCAVESAMFNFIDISAEGHVFTTATLQQSTHVLGAAYKVICGPQGVQRKRESPAPEYIHIPSATKLKASGITITPIRGPLESTTYKNKCLTLPVMKMCDSTVAIVRNMAWYELCHVTDGCMFSDYMVIMGDLIQTPQDVEILIKCGVIRNYLGTMAFKRWSELDEDMIIFASSVEHHHMKQDIIRQCKYKRYKLWVEFVALFCSRPWLAISAFTVFIVTVATLIQTYATVIASKGMKPHFPP